MEAISVNTAILEYLNGQTRNLDYLLNTIITTKSLPSSCLKFFTDCQSIAHTFSSDLAVHFYRIFLEEKSWYTFEGESSYQCASLLISLAVHHPLLIPELCVSIGNALFACDLPNVDTPETSPPYYFLLISRCVKLLLEIIPQAETQLIDSIISLFPSWRSSTIDCFSALSNSFGLLTSDSIKFNFCDASILSIFDTACRLLVELETNANIKYDSEVNIFDSLNNMFDYKFFEENNSHIRSLLSMNGAENDRTKVEIMKWLLIEFLWRKCPNNISSISKETRTDWNQLCSIFRSLRNRFIQDVLPVRSEFFAFPVLLVFLCSLRQGFIVSFVESLWKIVKDTRQSTEIRIRTITYLADYLARGTHCSQELIFEQVNDMALWCVEYTYFHRGALLSNIDHIHQEHQLFYTVFEGIIYIITFRHETLLGSSVCRKSYSRLPIGQLVNCPYRPMQFVKSELGLLFYVVSSSYKFNWPITIPTQLSEVSLLNVPESTATYGHFSPHVLPSFKCPFLLSSISPFSSDNFTLFQKFVPSKRFLKHYSKISPEVFAKRVKPTHHHFDFEALANLQSQTFS